MNLVNSTKPFSIMNIDLKLMSKILAERLNSFLPILIDRDQVGFVPKRQAADNIRRALTFIHMIQEKSIPGSLLSIDLSKAFDSVSWPYLHYIMEKWGFKPKFRHTIKALYNHPTAYVKWGPYHSNSFSLSGGTRQGCPLSPILFILALEPLATLIRENTDITGLSQNSTQHKVCLFADNILMLITKPLTTLPNLINIFNKFAEISGLNINYSKSHALNINLPQTTVKLLKLNFDFHWQTQHLKYLGINITANIQDLYKHNYPSLWKELTEMLENWSKYEISWIGRIHATRMTILPKVLYYFRTLPIGIPRSDIDRLQNQVMKFIWNARPPRVSKATMLSSRLKGGLGVPDIGKYYQAAQLSSIPLLFANPPPKWVTMEEAETLPIKLAATPWTPYVLRPNNLTPMLEQTLNTWDRVKYKTKLLSPHFPASPLLGNPEFPPGLEGKPFQWCENRGVKFIKQVYGLTGPLKWERFQQQYAAPQAEIFRYLQVLHYLKSKHNESNTPPSSYLEIICISYPYSRGVLSKLYQILLEAYSPPNLPYMKAWEGDLGYPLNEDTWIKVWDSTAHSSINTSLPEAGYKVLLRWYLVPARLHKINNAYSSQCFRGCGEEGTAYHIWWQCPRVQCFWTRVYELIFSATEINLRKSPEQALIGTKIPNINKHSRTLITQIFIAAKLTIAKSWKSPLLPIQQLKHKINWILVNEKLTSILNDKQKQF
uniref:Reverse transcriptase domain-containing protein n=1 Tax=Xenopus tropicalis TaxID=8364 RepID=A0A6I8Q4E7_XENTR